MILETKRLYLREMDQPDFDSLCGILQNPKTMYAYEGAFNDQEVLEIAYLFEKSYWHQGYATKALYKKTEYPFPGNSVSFNRG